MRKIFVLLIALAGSSLCMAQNPVVQTIYTPDPAPMVYNDTVFLYTGHDEDGSTWFTMNDWHVYSTTDMVNWTDRGTPLSLETFSWATENAWASQCIERNGKFYWYVCAGSPGTGMAIGVAVSDSPTGPFFDAIGRPLCQGGWGYIDPTVFIDDDGQAYLYWGNPGIFYVKLNEDMISYSGGIVEITQTVANFGGPIDPQEGVTYTDLYEEGPWFYKRNGKYYLLYAAGGVPEHISYSMSDSPTGPWEYKGKIMPLQDTRAFTNHCGVIDFKGNSYFFYHTGMLPGGGGFTRSTAVESFVYNPDGTFPTINMTQTGVNSVANLNPYQLTKAATIAWEEGIETTENSQIGVYVHDIDNGDYIKVRSVDFGAKGAGIFTANVSCGSNGGIIELHLDSKTGIVIGTLPVSYTGGWNVWKDETTHTSGATGVHDLYLVFKGTQTKEKLFQFNSWKFGENGTFSNPVIYADAPDPSVIRVGNTFYMVSTTMHYSPGCGIMKSYDLVNWEVVNYAYDFLDKSDRFSLKNGRNEYANGSWAANIRYDKYEKRFYLIVTCNSTEKSYMFTTADIENGPWHRSVITKCFDPGLLFVDTGTECLKYIVNPSEDMGNHKSYLRSFTVDANHDVKLGEATVIIDYANIENPATGLRAEGYHGFKVGDYYYIFMIQGARWQRQEIVWRSKSLTPGSFEVRRVFAGNIVDSNGKDFLPFNGIAQGGIVDTEDGHWYALLFQDYGAVGRIPVLLPMEWKDGWPLIGNNGKSVNHILPKPVAGHPAKSVVVSDEFDNGKVRKIISEESIGTRITAGISQKRLSQLKQRSADAIKTVVEANEYGYNGSNLKMAWQWNHNPNNNLWSLTERKGYLRLKSGLLANNIQQARNTLTQRTFGPVSSANTAIEVSRMNDGDVAGIASFQDQYGFVGVHQLNGQRFLIMQRAQKKGDAQGIVVESIPLNQERVYLRVDCDFRNKTDKAYFYYSLNGEQWIRIGDFLQMNFDWPHFTGQRFALFYYSTEAIGGCVDFDYFHVSPDILNPQTQTLSAGNTFCNPLNLDYRFGIGTSMREAADPVVTLFHDDYYLFASKSGGYWWSSDFKHWNLVIPTGIDIEKYAPSVFVIGDTMYYTSSESGAIYKTTDPKGGKWTYISQPVNWNDPWVFVDTDGRVYGYYGCSENGTIDCVELDPNNNFKQIGSVVTCLRTNTAEHGFEVNGENNEGGLPWTEGGAVIKHNNKYYLQYATPGTEKRSYCDGYYVADSPMGPFTFGDNSPVTRKSLGYVTGTGHGGTFYDKQGKLWTITCVSISKKAMFERRLAVFPVEFDENGRMYANTVMGDYPQYLPGTMKRNHFEYNRPLWNLLSKGKTATASSTFKDCTSDKVLDEDMRTWWSATSGKAGEWLSVDLGTTCTVNAIQTNYYESETSYASGREKSFTTKYKVEYSTDNQTWHTVIDKSGSTTDTPHDYVELDKPVQARYLKITNRGDAPGYGYFALSDFRIFGTSNGAPPVAASVVESKRLSDERCANVQWETVADADGYIIRYGVEPDKLWNHSQIGSGNSCTIKSLVVGQTYYFRVDAYNESGITEGKSLSVAPPKKKISIDVTKKGHDVAKSMYGIFFEEINHGGEGGIYPDLIQNRAFEEQVIPSGFTYRIVNGEGRIYCPDAPHHENGEHRNFNWPWNIEAKKYQAWSLVGTDCTVEKEITANMPLHPNTPNALRLTVADCTQNGKAELINSGYWGVAVKNREKYNLRFYLRTTDYKGKVVAKIYDPASQAVVASRSFKVKNNGQWCEYTAELTANQTIDKGDFRLAFVGNGTIYVDYVSLLPQTTYKGHGLRKDLCEFLADLKPAFMRWPGGCVVEGTTLENRIKWKETLGDPMTRRGEYMRWGYRSSLGFGYHEYLQLCEDMGADAMFVSNVGLACNFENGDYAPEEDWHLFLQDLKDAIEYAIGDPATNEWAAKRAAAGHPKPFPLKYVELGNEHWSKHYAKVHEYFYSNLKPIYPQLTFICTYGMSDVTAHSLDVDMIDPHYYAKPDFFYRNVGLFDKVERGKYDIYVGEYACNGDVGSGNMEAALSEAAFITGMERNSDIVKLTSYAPLLTNVNQPNWSCNLIWYDNHQIMGRASYYVQKMFAENRPDYNIKTSSISDGQPLTENSGRLQAIGGYDKAKGEIVIKVVNAESEFMLANIIINAKNIRSEGTVITLSADSLKDENSMAAPKLIYPETTPYAGFSSDFNYTFKPNSFTILRIKVGLF